MNKFDFNKLSKYKEFMEENGIYEFKFNCGTILLLDFKEKYFELWNNGECEIDSYKNFEEFKEEVVNYFLNK